MYTILYIFMYTMDMHNLVSMRNLSDLIDVPAIRAPKYDPDIHVSEQ